MKPFRCLQSLILIFCILLSALPVAAVETEQKDYIARMVYLSDKDVGEGMTVSNNGLTKVERDGRYGKRSDFEGSGLYYWCNVSDELLYNIPEHTPIDIVVEYFDESNGFFSMYYDSYHPDSYSYVTQGPWKVTDKVQLTNTKTWKTHTFHLEDAKFTNGENNCDFRLGLYDDYNKYSSGDVVIGSITVKYSEHCTSVKARLETEKNGNIFDSDEGVTFKSNYLNLKDKTCSFRAVYTVHSSDGSVAKEVIIEDTIDAGTEKELSLNLFETGAICDVYTLKATIDSWYTDNPDEKRTQTFDKEFSVAKLLNEGEGNSTFGTSQNPIQWNIGDMDVLPDLMVKDGMTWWRDSIIWESVETTKGQYKIPDAAMDKLKKAKEKGIKILLICASYNQFYDGGKTPCSEEGIAAYARYCAFLARELRGLVDAFEIWNEYDIQAFNNTKEPPETYAKMLKAAYTEIKKENPDAIVAGLGVAHIEKQDFDFPKRVFAAGGLDYMDVVSCHPYDWTSEFREQLLIENINTVRELMREYGKEKPVWFTEFGFATYEGVNSSTPTQELQAQKYAFMQGVMQAYNLAELNFQYSMTDRYEGRPEQGNNWGIIFGELNRYRPNAAKKAYLAMAAFNSLLGSDALYEEMLTDDRFYAFKYKNNKLGKNIVQLVSGKGEKAMTYDFGTNQVEVYDIFGNLITAMYSPDGRFTFPVNEETVYVIGDMKKFEMSDAAPHIAADKVNINATKGDTATYQFSKAIDKELIISVDEAKGISVERNDGFKNNNAELVLRLSDDAEGEISFAVTVADTAGKVYYKNKHTVTVIDDVTITISAEEAVKGSNSHWRARVTVKSNSNTRLTSGTLRVTGPDDVAAIASEKGFAKLLPQEEISYLFNIPERVIKNTVLLEVKVKTEIGFEKDYSKLLDFGTAVYTSKAPQIDGIASPGEWSGSWIATVEEKDFVALDGEWGGTDDLSFSGTAMWDEENFYFLAVVNDNVSSINYTPKTAGNAWKGDSIQIGIDDTVEKNPIAVAEFTELILAKHEIEGDMVYRGRALYDIPVACVAEKAKLCVRQYQGHTIYEAAIPWSEIFYEGYEVDTNRRYAFNMVVNDNDGKDRRGYMEYTAGIGDGKDSTKFGAMYFNR